MSAGAFVALIPARYASRRLPGKALADIDGRPMIAHVLERARESGAARVVVATDDTRIARAVEAAGGEPCVTAAGHRSGTERLAEAAGRLGLGSDTVVVNVQGDEPLLPPVDIAQVAENLRRHRRAAMATLCEPIVGAAELADPNVVKVVTDAQGMALYFSRAPIPWDREGFAAGAPVAADPARHRRHIGLYAYRVSFLEAYAAWPPCPLERLESLEQLRALHHGARIHVDLARAAPGPGVDTPADLERVRALVAAARGEGGERR